MKQAAIVQRIPELGAAKLSRTGAPVLLREPRTPPEPPLNAYEDQGSGRVARGSVTLPAGGWWFAKLEVPMAGDQSALLTIGRYGSGAGLEPAEATLVVAPGEADAVLALIHGLIAQAKADGVLREAPPPAF